MPNSMNFYKMIFLHVVPVRTIVPCKNGDSGTGAYYLFTIFNFLMGIRFLVNITSLNGNEITKSHHFVNSTKFSDHKSINIIHTRNKRFTYQQ